MYLLDGFRSPNLGQKLAQDPLPDRGCSGFVRESIRLRRRILERREFHEHELRA